MRQYLTIKTLHIIIWIILLVSIIVKAWYYTKLKHNKSFKQFLLDYFIWTPETVRDNMGATKTRKKYLQANNILMLMLWLLLLIQLILLFVGEGEKSRIS